MTRHELIDKVNILRTQGFTPKRIVVGKDDHFDLLTITPAREKPKLIKIEGVPLVVSRARRKSVIEIQT